MLGFIKSTPENLKLILANLQSSAIMDLLLTLIRLEELPEAKGMVQVDLYKISSRRHLLIVVSFSG